MTLDYQLGDRGRVVVSADAFKELLSTDETCASWRYTTASVRGREVNTTKTATNAHGCLAPFFDGAAYSGRAVRHALETTTRTLREVVHHVEPLACCATFVATEDAFGGWAGTYNRSVGYCAARAQRVVPARARDDPVPHPRRLQHLARRQRLRRGRGRIGGAAVGQPDPGRRPAARVYGRVLGGRLRLLRAVLRRPERGAQGGAHPGPRLQRLLRAVLCGAPARPRRCRC